MNENYYRLYKEVGKKYKKLPQKMQLACLRTYKKTGDLKALEQILNANLPLVIDIASSFNRKGENQDLLMDFISVGYEESIKCLDRYKFGKGDCTVTSWIRNNVRNKIWSFLREHKKVVKINTSAYDKLSEDKKNRDKFFAKNGFFPIKGQILKHNGETYKFKNEYDLSIVDGRNENGDDEVFSLIPDFNEEDFFPTNSLLKNTINNIAKKILNSLEYKVIDLHYNKKIKISDVNKYICPQNEEEFNNVLKTGKNTLKIILNNKKYIYNIYHSAFLTEKKIMCLEKGKKMFENQGILNNKNIYTSNGSIDLFFSSNDNVLIYLNNKKVECTIDDENEKYELVFNKKSGVVHSKMHIHNVHESAIKKLRAYLLKYKINSYE